MKQAFLLSLLFLGASYLQAQPTLGVISNDPESFDGYTLFSPSGSLKTTFLIDNCGQVVNSWQSGYASGNSNYLLEDGSLLHTARLGNNPTFQFGGTGGRLEKYDWAGNLVWEWEYSNSDHIQHHDVEPLPNGNILVLAAKYHTDIAAINEGRDTALFTDNMLWSEEIVEIQPIGTDSAVIVWRWDAWDHLIQDYDSTKNNYGVVADHPELMDINFVGQGADPDWFHANSVAYNPILDQITISMHDIHEIWIIDHSTTTAEAATHSGGNSGMGGDILYRWGNPQAYRAGSSADQVLSGQHDVRWIPQGYPNEGKLMVFNNGVDFTVSEVHIFTPPIDTAGNYSITPGSAFGPTSTDWDYTTPNHATFISGAHPLPNGNTLVCEGPQAHFIEVGPMDTIVWEYYSPVSGGSVASQGTTLPNPNRTFRATRYAPDFAGFVGKDMTPGDPIELNFDLSHCQLYSNVEETVQAGQWRFFPNPASDQVYIEYTGPEAQQADLSLYNALGQVVLQKQMQSNFEILDISKLEKGIYLLRVGEQQTHKLIVGE